MDIPICQVINRMRQQVVVPQFGIEASRPLWPMHGHDESAFESSRKALRVFDRLNLAQLIGQVFHRHAEPGGNGLSIELLGKAPSGGRSQSGQRHCCVLPSPSSRYVPYAIDISSKSGRPPLFREAFSKVRLSILCRHSGDRIPPNGAGCSTVALGSVAGQVVEPVLYLPLSIYLVYVNYITTGA